MATYDIVDFGAVGDVRTDNAQVIQKAIDTCHAARRVSFSIERPRRTKWDLISAWFEAADC